VANAEEVMKTAKICHRKFRMKTLNDPLESHRRRCQNDVVHVEQQVDNAVSIFINK
jgi:hypothetical protein